MIEQKTIRQLDWKRPLLDGHRGAVSVEYILLIMLICIALALGKPSILEQLISALQMAYMRFSTAISLP